MAFWRGPDDQPAWARPALLGIAAVSAVLYGWSSTGNLEIFYAAGVRSMSMSWHNFFFEAFDPRATVTLDKLPGAFWIQALSVRLFGVHAWAFVAPQVVEGTLTVFVIYRVVRRLAGPIAAITAAAVLALSPATVALNRGNISDTLMVLLLVLAADAAVTAVTTGPARSILVAGLWVGLAFQAKMVEAWLATASVGVVYLLCAPAVLRRRVWQLVATGVVVVVVSLSWMTVVTLTPPSGRPYVDGSTSNSVFQQVFVYNGFGRLDQPSPNQLLNQAIGLHIALSGPAAWNRFLAGSYGRDIGWLVPACLIILVSGLIARRRRPRDDLIRAGLLLWGTWLIVFGVVLSASSNINPYYAAALSPALAGLVGTGVALAWESRRSRVAPPLTAGVILVSAGYAAWLLPARGTGLPDWLYPLVIVLGVATAAAVLLRTRRPAATGQPLALLALGTVVLLAVPAVASVSIVTNRLGPFDTPFQPSAVNAAVRTFVRTTNSASELLPKLEQARFGAPDLMATQTSALASPFIYSSGLEVLPIGGYAGTGPEPTLAELQSMIKAGDFHLVLQSRTVTDPRLVWVAQNCRLVVSANASSTSPFDAYFCGSIR
jgi:4-amino-4-deoxy-L-arabinose transferase-like glycosyltransferase